MRCRYFYCRLFFYFLSFVFALLLTLPPSRNSDPRSHSRLFSPPDGGPYLKSIIICYERKVQIVQTNRKLSGRSTAQNKQHEKWSEAAPEIGVYLGLQYEMRKVTTFQQCCRHENFCSAVHRLTVHSTQCHPPCWKISQNKCLPHAPVRSISLTGTLCCFLPCYMRFLRNIQKQETLRLKPVQFLAKTKIRPQTLKCSSRNPKRIHGRLNGVFFRGHVDPLYQWCFLQGACRPFIDVPNFHF